MTGCTMFDKLKAPFPPEAVSWRAQSLTKDGSKAMALCYIDARDVMGRLDDVCGPDGWQDRYTETAKGRLICTIEILCGDQWISKSDGAGDTDVEGEKGAISDAFKRCAVKWGVGRYLYDAKTPWAECESYERNGKLVWKAWTANGLRQLSSSLPSPSTPAPEMITDRTRDLIAAKVTAAQYTIQKVCSAFEVQSLTEMTEADGQIAIELLDDRIAKIAQKQGN